MKTEGVICLETPQRKRASSRLEGKASRIFSSCGGSLSSYDASLSSYDGALMDPLLCLHEGRSPCEL